MPDKFVGSLTGVRTADQTKTLVTLNCDNGGGDLYLANNAGTWTIAARAVGSKHCGLWMGGSGQFGLLTLRNGTGKDTVNLGNSETGDLYMRDKDGNWTVALRAVENNYCGMWMGGTGRFGLITLRNSKGKDTVNLGNGETGDLYLRNADGNFTVALRAVENDMAGIWVGGSGQNGHSSARRGRHEPDPPRRQGRRHHPRQRRLRRGVRGRRGGAARHGDGDRRRRRLHACAEAYAAAWPGSSPAPATRAGHRPRARGRRRRRTAIALAGKVGCRVDAREEPIAVGDLLDHRARAGHAMRAATPRGPSAPSSARRWRRCAATPA